MSCSPFGIEASIFWGKKKILSRCSCLGKEYGPGLAKRSRLFSFTLFTLCSRGLSSKESAYQCRKCKRHGFDPWVRKIPWRRKWQLVPLFLPGKFHGQRSLERKQSMWLQSVRHDLVTEHNLVLQVESHLPQIHVLRYQPLVPQNVDLFGNRVFTDITSYDHRYNELR